VGANGSFRWTTSAAAVIAIANPSRVAREVRVNTVLFTPPGTDQARVTFAAGEHRRTWTVGQSPLSISFALLIGRESSVNLHIDTSATASALQSSGPFVGIGDFDFEYDRGRLDALVRP
jgi:hypothetical protein